MQADDKHEEATISLDISSVAIPYTEETENSFTTDIKKGEYSACFRFDTADDARKMYDMLLKSSGFSAHCCFFKDLTKAKHYIESLFELEEGKDKS